VRSFPRSLIWLALAFVVVGSYLPVAAMVIGAARDGGGFLAEAVSVLSQPRRTALLLRSVAIAGGTAAASGVLGLPFALLVSRSDLPAAGIFRGAMLLPLLIPSYVFALGWQRVFDLAPAWAPDVAAPWGVVAVLTLRFFPLVVLLLAAGLDRVERGLEDAGRLHRGAPWVLLRITLPLTWPRIAAAALVVFNLALMNYTVPSLLRVPTFPVEIFAAFSGLFDVGGAVALSLPLIAIGALSVVLARLAIGARPFVVTPARDRPDPLVRLGRARPAAWAAALAAVALTAVVPVVAVASLLAGPGDLLAAYALGMRQVWRTLALAAAAATVLSIHGLVAGCLMARARSILADLFFLLPLALPPTVLGIGLIRLWNRPPVAALMDSAAIVVLAYCAQFVPFVAATAASAVASVPPELEEAALVSGMGWWSRARVILVPLVWRGLAAGWILAFALCLDEVGASILVHPPDGETLAVRIYNLSHYDAAEMVGGLCLVVLAIVAVPVLGYALLARRRHPKDPGIDHARAA
jgi:ABC-type Fe3+ transport system permease subunit